MKIGFVGYQGSGKSSLFTWLTGTAADIALQHTTQSAMAAVPDPRVAGLIEIYQPKKISLASLELVDTPGLSRTHEGNAARLSLIREAGCLAIVTAGFSGCDPMADLRTFEEDLLLADLEVVTGRVERLREAVKKPRPNQAEQLAELNAILPLLEVLEAGQSLSTCPMTAEQLRATSSFGLLTRKRRLVIANVAEDDTTNLPTHLGEQTPVIAVPVGWELELSQMSPDEQAEFRRESGSVAFDRDGLLRTLMAVSGQMLFFTAGPKDVRTWMIPQGATALDAAAAIHTDLARGFIRAEIMSCADLIRLGGEREVKQQNLVRQEAKDYLIQDGDILNIRFSV